jgi:RNA polymerase sigma-70 factor (ECF subfamily)
VASIPEAWLVVPAGLVGDRDEERPAATGDGDGLLARALRRDEAALAALYTAHAPAVLRFLSDLLGDRAAAADATQETFVRAFRRLGTLRAADRITPWLFGIARNVSLEMRKARRRRGRVLVPDDGDAAVPEGADAQTPESQLLGREAAHVVEAALGRLSEDRRALLLLRLDHGLAYEDIAAAMGFSLSEVKVEIWRARQILRAELAAYGGSEG